MRRNTITVHPHQEDIRRTRARVRVILNATRVRTTNSSKLHSLCSATDLQGGQKKTPRSLYTLYA